MLCRTCTAQHCHGATLSRHCDCRRHIPEAGNFRSASATAVFFLDQSRTHETCYYANKVDGATPPAPSNPQQAPPPSHPPPLSQIWNCVGACVSFDVCLVTAPKTSAASRRSSLWRAYMPPKRPAVYSCTCGAIARRPPGTGSRAEDRRCRATGTPAPPQGTVAKRLGGISVDGCARLGLAAAEGGAESLPSPWREATVRAL